RPGRPCPRASAAAPSRRTSRGAPRHPRSRHSRERDLPGGRWPLYCPLLPAPCSSFLRTSLPARAPPPSPTADPPPPPPRARHVELGFLLVAVESQLDQHFALGRGHIAWREAIEREHEYVAAARLAAAESGQLGTQLRVLPLHHLERHVRHPTTASSSSGTAV